jgi:peptide deformylase
MSREPISLKIITYGHPSLRVRCAPVTEFTPELRDFAEDMFKTMFDNDGIGLAASQVDRRIRLLVIGMPQKDSEEVTKYAIVNPEIVESRGTWDYEEGCLSLPEIRDTVTRPAWIKLKYQDLDGVERVIETDGLFARVLQHETDHLNGVLFIDHLSPIRRALLRGKLRALARENSKVTA